jgi:hypothetical protein
MLVSKTNRLALACSLALAAGCAGGEELAANAGGSGGTTNPPWMNAGGSAAAAAGGGAAQQGGGGAGGYGGVSGSTLAGGSSGAGAAGAAGTGSGGTTYISPIGTGGSSGSDAAAAGSGGAPAIDGGSGCGMAGFETAPVTDGGITLRYRNQDGGAKGSAIQFDLEISTSNAAGVAASDIEIRYYFTNEVGEPLVNEMYWAGTSTDALTSAVTTKIVPMAAVPGADTYASYTLPASTAKIGPVNALTIKPAHHKAGYGASFNQCDDYSYGANRDFMTFTRIAVFVKGVLAWGSVPGQAVLVDASAPEAQTQDAANDGTTADALSGEAADDAVAKDAPSE